MSRPNVFIVGAAKAGTTFLWSALGQHPDVHMSPRKEPDYFSDDYGQQRIDDLRGYLSLFEGARGASVVGEASISYLISASSAHRIASFNPEARIIVSLRNPSELIASLHAQLIKEGRQPVIDLQRAYEASLQPDFTPPQVGEPWTRYRDVIRFSEQVSRFRRVFPSEQIHLLRFEDLSADPQSALAGICQFLRVRKSFEWGNGDRNERQRTRSPALAYLMRTPPALLRRFTRLLPLSARQFLGRAIMRMNTTTADTSAAPSPWLTDETAAAIYAEIQNASAALGIDTSIWEQRTAALIGSEESE